MPRYTFIIILAAVLLFLGYPALKKIIIPPLALSHLADNPKSFDYDKIYEQDQLKAALEVIIKEGMPKSDVDAIFIDSAGANSQSIQEDKVLYFKHNKAVKLFCGVAQNDNPEWKFAVQYDSEMKVVPFEDKTKESVLYDALWPCF